MKKLILVLTMILLSVQALALESETFVIGITINQKPVIASFAPADGHVIIQGDTLQISVTASDPNAGNVLEYQFIINDVVRKTWGNDSQFSFPLEESDTGLNSIKVEVTDGLQTVETEEVEIYVFRQSPDLPQ